MIQIKKLLVPTDFSQHAYAAIKYGCELARRFSAELHLLHVVDNNITAFSMEMEMVGASGFALNTVEAKDRAAQQLAEIPGEDGRGCRIIRVVEIGLPSIDLTRYAKDNGIDLIIISTHGRTGLNHILMGSLAETVVRKSPCPVLTVRPEGHQFTPLHSRKETIPR